MNKKCLLSFIKEGFVFSWKDALISVCIMLICSFVCIIFRKNDTVNTYASMLFLLAVFLISFFTNGYLFGTVSSFLSVLIINYYFTEPFSEFNFTLEGYPLTILCGLIVSIVTSTLVTKTKKANELKIIAEKEKTRSNLLRAVSHDLRTPLTTILGSTSAIIENDGDISREQRLKLLVEIKEDSQWLIRMVENLLMVTRIDDGNEAKITKTSEAVEEIVSEAVMKFRKRFPDLKLRVRVPDELLMVPMDALLIEQVIVNLLENVALHAENATEAAIVVSMGNEGVVFEVSDNGCGIDKGMINHIFDIYKETQPGNGLDSKKNMGIGLPVCKTIVKAHNGRMTVRNNPDGGATFSFVLPV